MAHVGPKLTFHSSSVESLVPGLNQFLVTAFEVSIRLFHLPINRLPLHRVANRPRQNMAIHMAFDQVILGSMLHRFDCEFLVVHPAQYDDGKAPVGSLELLQCSETNRVEEREVQKCEI